MQLIHKTEHIGNMLDNVTANYFFKFIIGERVWKNSEIVNDICMTQSIRIDTDRGLVRSGDIGLARSRRAASFLVPRQSAVRRHDAP